MSLSRTVFAFFALAPLAFGASKEIQELQRDVAMLQDQVRNLQSALDMKVAAMQTIVQQTLDSANRTNTAMAVMDNKFSDAIKQQQQSLNGPVANVGQKLDQMSEDFRAVRESVLDMNTRIGKLDAKMADLQNLINTVRTPAPPPPATAATPQADATTSQPSGPPAGVTAEATYTNAFRDYTGGKYDLAFQEFSDYLKYFKDLQFAPNAQFYLGQIYYHKQDYENAIQAFDAVLEHYSDNSKTAEAHYWKAVSLMALSKNDSAAREFRDVYTRYVESDPDLAAKAKARLKDMGLTVGPVVAKRRKAR
jgi:TolA-binding protein